MLILKIILVVAAMSSLVFGLSRFNLHCSRKFGHMFFTKSMFYATATALAFIVAGCVWRQSAVETNGDQLNGVVLIVIGALIAIAMIVGNIRQTNLVYGIGGSIVQLGIFSVLAYVSITVMIVVLFFQFLMLVSAKRVYVINR
jgi:hypothetical protein